MFPYHMQATIGVMVVAMTTTADLRALDNQTLFEKWQEAAVESLLASGEALCRDWWLLAMRCDLEIMRRQKLGQWSSTCEFWPHLPTKQYMATAKRQRANR